MMLQVIIPNSFLPERKYIIEVILNSFLGIDYELVISDFELNYVLKVENKFCLIFEDHFFNKFNKTGNYLTQENIPETVEEFASEFSIEKQIIIFGRNFYKRELIGEIQNITIGLDIFASSFFMLSRWEEFVNERKDQHLRFICTESLSQKSNFHYRAIVNEYVELLNAIFKFLNFSFQQKQRQFSIIPTHDVDYIRKYHNVLDCIKTSAADIFKRRSFSKSIHTISDFIKLKTHKINDPYDTFDYLMLVSEKHNLSSVFCFIFTKTPDFECDYTINDIDFVKTLKKIEHRGHQIGIHASYFSFHNSTKFAEEVKIFNNLTQNSGFGRQHFLRFSIPEIWQSYEDNYLKTSSSLGFTNDAGFRCGTCFEFPVFNIATRKQLNLIENPLIMMDVALKKKYPDEENYLKQSTMLAEECKKFNGNFLILWHNSSFNVDEWKRFHSVYENILSFK